MRAVGYGNFQEVQHCHQCEECDVTKIQHDIVSVAAVLEMRTEDVRGLRKEMEMRMWMMEEKGTQTEEVKEEYGSYEYETDR